MTLRNRSIQREFNRLLDDKERKEKFVVSSTDPFVHERMMEVPDEGMTNPIDLLIAMEESEEDYSWY